jgi:hypothetical protein
VTEDEKLEQLDIFKTLERGRRLFQLRNTEGYNDLLDMLEAEVVKSEYRLMNTPAGSSNDLLRDLHAHARAARTIFEQLQIRLNTEIEHGKSATLEAVNDYKTTNL